MPLGGRLWKLRDGRVCVPPSCIMPTPPRRFPPPWAIDELEACFVVAAMRRASSLLSSLTAASSPWSVEETSACFVLRDANGEVLAYVYCGTWRSCRN
jgi:hypothetical protein